MFPQSFVFNGSRMNPYPDKPVFPDATAFHSLLNRRDWTGCPLGHPATWPLSLRANVNLMLDALVPMSILWGPQRTLLYNEAYAAFLAEKHPWALGRDAEEVWPEVWPDVRPQVERAYAGERLHIEDMPLALQRGGRRDQGWFTIFHAPLRDDDGELRGMCSTIVETTSRVKAERDVHELNRTLEERVRQRTAELESSRAHLLSLFGQTAAGIAEAGLDMRVVRANDTYCRIIGRSQEETVGVHLGDLIHPDDLAANVHLLEEMLRTGKPCEVENRYLRPDNTPVWVSKMIAPITVPGNDSPASFLAVVIDVTRRRQAEMQLRDSAERLRLATDAAKLGIWSWEVFGDKASWENEQMCELLGVPRTGEPVSLVRFLHEIIHPDDAQSWRQALERTLETGERFHCEGRFFRASDGALRWFEFTGLLHRDGEGRPQRMVGTAADVTESKEIVDRLRDAQARLEATLNAGEVGTWLFDIREDKLYADANMIRLHGVSEEAAATAQASVWVAAIHPDDRAPVLACVEAAVKGGEPYAVTYRAMLPGGQCRVFHARGKVEYDQGVPALLPGVVLDITQRMDMEAKLRTREEHYRTLLTSIDEGFCIAELVFDADGRPVDHRFLETNPAYERHTGLVNAVGRTARELAPGVEQRWHDVYARVAAGGEPVRFVDYVEPLGRWFDVFVARAQSDANDKVAVVFRDISTDRRVHEELRQLAADLSTANQRQNEFLATLAHELRNPLAPIRTGLELLRMAPDNAAAIGKVHGIMERQVIHLVHLVDDLLDLARIQSGKVELKKSRVALGGIVDSAVETAQPLIQEKRHRLRVRVPDEPVWLDADPHRLAQVIGNLLTNAAKYTPQEGMIDLVVRREGAEAVVEVADNGIGVPAEALPALFQMFSQGRNGMDYAQGGLGIGLNLVKRLTEMHGGAVSAASPGPNQGSTFTLRLPVAPENAPDALKHVETAARTRSRLLRILVADDNLDAANLLAQMLELDGHQVRTAHDGGSALEAAKSFLPDLALLDIGMPGMDGYELARAIRREPTLRHVLLAAVTGWGAREDRARSRSAGFDEHLTKPIDMDSLGRLVAAVRPVEADPAGQQRPQDG